MSALKSFILTVLSFIVARASGNARYCNMGLGRQMNILLKSLFTTILGFAASIVFLILAGKYPIQVAAVLGFASVWFFVYLAYIVGDNSEAKK